MLGPGKNILYVLLNGALTLNPTKKQEYKSSSLAFINLSTGEVTKRVSVGWNAGTVALSDDGKHVVCFAHGQKAGRNFKRDMPSRLTVIDIQTQQVSARISNGFLWRQVLFNRELSRIFVLGRHREGGRKEQYDSGKPYLLVYELGLAEPVLAMGFDKMPMEMILSRDEKFLYVLENRRGFSGQKESDGQLHVIDVQEIDTLAKHDVGTRILDIAYDEVSDGVSVISYAAPRDRTGRLYQIHGREIVRVDEICKLPQFIQRYGGQPGLFVWGRDEISYIPDVGPSLISYIGLSKKSSAHIKSGSGAKIVGYPREILYLPDSGMVAFREYRLNQNAFLPSGRVGLLDLKSKALEQVVVTGRSSVKTNKILVRAMLMVELGPAVSYAPGAGSATESSGLMEINVQPNIEFLMSDFLQAVLVGALNSHAALNGFNSLNRPYPKSY